MQITHDYMSYAKLIGERIMKRLQYVKQIFEK